IQCSRVGEVTRVPSLPVDGTVFPLDLTHRASTHAQRGDRMIEEPRDTRPEIRLSQLSHGAG
ncbi:MAG: hypothetical protein ACPHO4_14410, partial [Longimicrobiales bacterium]